MPQINKTERKTIVLRVPRKYRYLIRAFGVWLKEYPDQAKLWQCEEYLSQTFEASAYKVDSPAWRQEINAAQVKVFSRPLAKVVAEVLWGLNKSDRLPVFCDHSA
jgi:hypothetical protein